MSKNTSTKKSKSTLFIKLIRTIIVLIVIGVSTVVGTLGGAILGYIRITDDIKKDDLILKNYTSSIYDYKGKFVTNLSGDTYRERIEFKDVPKNLKNAFIAIEDKRFYEHPGVDLKRLFSAVFGFMKSGSTTQGASTITQQVIKNITSEKQISLKRKAQEQWRALELERHLTKDQILELYLNVIPMGGITIGVEAGSKMYFGKSAKELTLAECASIAGITNAPAIYNPFTVKGRERNKSRQDIILKEMLSLNFISKSEYDKAIAEPLKFLSRERSVLQNVTQSYFIDQVVIDLKKDLIAKGYSEQVALRKIYNDGLKIYTTLDPVIQKQMDEVFSNKTHFSIVDKNSGTPQGAMVILDSKSSQIRALYGGSGLKTGSPLNRATQIQRQPGSTFKPIAVYGPAINEGIITAATVFDNAPVHMNGASKPRYPENYDHTFSGLTTVRDAIKSSLNVVAAKVWISKPDFPNMAHLLLNKEGIKRNDEKYVSVALGGLSKGVSPLQMAGAFAPFVNRGIYTEPTTYTKVEDAQGKLLTTKKLQPKIVYSEEAAFIITNILMDVCKSGTAYPLGLLNNGKMPTAGKTGTTSDNKDKWFLGYSPYYIGASWYGYDQPTTIIPAEYSRAQQLWHDVMEKAHANLAPLNFEQPSGIIKKTICIYSGKLATDLCSQDLRGSAVREEFFVPGTEPTESCNVHVVEKVCTASTDEFGRYFLTTPSCPESTVVSRLYIKRPQPYRKVAADDPYPLDYKFDLPEQYCKVHGNSESSVPTSDQLSPPPESTIEITPTPIQ